MRQFSLLKSPSPSANIGFLSQIKIFPAEMGVILSAKSEFARLSG